jgi:hypothetical protein
MRRDVHTAFIYTGSAGERREGDPERCRAGICVGGRMVGSFYQCKNKPVVFREIDHPRGLYGFCRTHDPVAVRHRQWKRDQEIGERCAAQQADFQLANDIEDAKDRCVDALRQIEAGHNDPRALAREILGQLDCLK